MAVTVTIEINEAALEQESGKIFRAFHKSLTRRIATQARADVPVKTGNLGRCIGELPQTYSPFHVDGGVEDTADYAAPVHEGSRPHIIRAKNGGYLAFEYRGQTIFRKQVNHPGTRARPFLRRAGTRVVAADDRIELEAVDLDS
jgi:hypothetical protein